MTTLSGQPVLIGRDREQQQLLDAVERAVEGLGGLVLVSGEAGIGKSTLVDNLREAVERDGCRTLIGTCYDLETTPPYGPWVEILRASHEDSDLPPVPGELRDGGGMARIDSQAALFDLAGCFFTEVAHNRPLVLILEDIHWADPASLDFLRYLARATANAPLLIIATYRDDEITGAHPLFQILPTLVRESGATRVELQRLSTASVTELVAVRYRLMSPDQARLVSYLDQMAEGNPFFINELLHALEERGTIHSVDGGWRLDDLTEAGVPSFVKQVIVHRLVVLDGPARIALDIAAVAGQDASLDILEALHQGEIDVLDDTLQRAFDHHLLILQPNGRTIRFSHALVRETVYESIPPLRRRSLHRQIGEQIARRNRLDPERIARHFYQAADERGLEWLVRAAEQAQALFAPETVVVRCRQAIDLADQLRTEPPLKIYRVQGLALETVGDFDEALASHETALERSRQQAERKVEWQALLDLAALWASRDYERTGEYCQQAVDLARTLEDPAALGHSLNRLGNWELNSGRSVTGLQNHREALEVFEQARDLYGRAVSLDLLAVGTHLAGSTSGALRYYEQAIPLLREVDDRKTLASALATAGAIAWGMGLTRSARADELPRSLGSSPKKLVDEAVEIARSVGWRSGLSYAHLTSGVVAIHLGAVRLGFEHLDRSSSIASEIDHKQWFVTAHLHMARCYLYLRVPTLCLEHVRIAESALSELSSNVWRSTANGLAGSAYVALGDLAAARSILPSWEVLSKQTTRPLFWAGWFGSAELASAEGQHELALEIADRLVELSSAPSGYVVPEIWWLKGCVLLACERYEEAEASLLEAREIVERFQFRLFLWRLHAASRRMYLAQGRIEDADTARISAMETIDELAKQIDDAEVCVAFLSASRAEVPGDPPFASSRSAQSAFGGLTPREVEVLQLVAQGITNDEVSEQLFISPRTVAQHLRSIYNKLDVNNRTAASRIAADHGLV